MKPFTLTRATSAAEAVKTLTAEGKFIAGGTNLLDLMKENLAAPPQLVDISRLPLNKIEPTKTGGVLIGALAKNAETANHPLIRQNNPLLSQAILAGASAQIRNMATNGGNLFQRTRCAYFYDVSMPCNKRESGSGCAAIGGLNKTHAVLGWSETCVAVHPSDMCVALAALDAKLHIIGKNGKERVMNFVDFHRLPEKDATRDNNLLPGEIVTAIELPPINKASKFKYLKVRERTSYAFALASAAVLFDVKDGKILNAKIALGGVAHKPWRAAQAEKFLNGKPATEENFKQAAEIALKDAKALSQNAYKITLAKRVVARALKMANDAGDGK